MRRVAVFAIAERDCGRAVAQLNSGLAAAYGLEGTVTVTFVPAQGKVDFPDDLVPAAGVMMDTAARDAQARAVRTALNQQLRQVADAALKRRARPIDTPADWRVEVRRVLKVAR